MKSSETVDLKINTQKELAKEIRNYKKTSSDPKAKQNFMRKV